MSDRRRRRWFAVDADWPFDALSTRLLEEFGLAGPMVWIAVTAAAKRSINEGRFSYTTEAEGWQALGLDQDSTPFELETFFRLTGRLHETRKRCSGRVTTIELRRWTELQMRIERTLDAERKARSRAETKADNPGTKHVTDRDPDQDTDPYTLSPGLAAAIEEARRDPSVVKAEAAGRWRYDQNPERYDAIAAGMDTEASYGTSPPRNDPATCTHRATDDGGWCAGCSTQVWEVPV